MIVFDNKNDLKKYLSSLPIGGTIGFTPTMGTLHKGHLELIRSSINNCTTSVCSIFINPTQFNNATDLNNYPKSLEEDLMLLKKNNCDVVYAPDVSDLYTKNEKVKTYDFDGLDSIMEGTFRPGHFNGMATIVAKLLKIVQADSAYFGQKDLQQLQIVKRLTQLLQFKTKIVGIQTVREANGLAKSSRNKLLTAIDKKQASLIYQCLKYCRNNKKKGIPYLKNYITHQFKQYKNFKLEYAEIVALNTMLPIEKWKNENENAVCIAAYHSGVRLIDNIIL